MSDDPQRTGDQMDARIDELRNEREKLSTEIQQDIEAAEALETKYMQHLGRFNEIEEELVRLVLDGLSPRPKSILIRACDRGVDK